MHAAQSSYEIILLHELNKEHEILCNPQYAFIGIVTGVYASKGLL